MHARIDSLLKLRDGEPVAAEVAGHVRQCPICSGELQRLVALRAELQALPEFEPPSIEWQQITEAASRRRASFPPRKVGLAAAAAAAITLAVIAVVARMSDFNGSDARSALVTRIPISQRDVPHVNELVAQSQQLEQVLQTLPQRPRIERVSTAATIETLQDRIQWLDFRLSNASEADLNEEQSRQLWRERVELLDSLVKVRSAEAGSIWF